MSSNSPLTVNEDIISSQILKFILCKQVAYENHPISIWNILHEVSKAKEELTKLGGVFTTSCLLCIGKWSSFLIQTASETRVSRRNLYNPSHSLETNHSSATYSIHQSLPTQCHSTESTTHPVSSPQKTKPQSPVASQLYTLESILQTAQ